MWFRSFTAFHSGRWNVVIAECGECGNRFRVQEEDDQDFRRYACKMCGTINRISLQRMAAREVEFVDEKH